MPVLLLTTTGRKSGAARTRPIGYLANGDRLVVCGSNSGSDRPAAWALNLQAKPSAAVELRSERFPVTAIEITGAEYDSLWAAYTAAYPNFARYGQKTTRHLPLFALLRSSRPA